MGFPSFIARLFRREPTVVPPEMEPMDQPIPETALAALQSAVWSPDAPINVEFCSGTPFWEDENYDVFMLRCGRGRCDRWQEPFVYRLYLITGQRNRMVDYETDAWRLGSLSPQGVQTGRGYGRSERHPPFANISSVSLKKSLLHSELDCSR